MFVYVYICLLIIVLYYSELEITVVYITKFTYNTQMFIVRLFTFVYAKLYSNTVNSRFCCLQVCQSLYIAHKCLQFVRLHLFTLLSLFIE